MTTRLPEILWVVDHLKDLEADFLRFYGIDDLMELDSRRLMRLAWRIPAYGGVIAVIAEKEGGQTKQAESSSPVVQRMKVTQGGGQVATVEYDGPSYLHSRISNN